MYSKTTAFTAMIVLATSTMAFAQTPAPMMMPSGGITVKLAAQNGSGETGTATLVQAGDNIMVSVTMTGGGAVVQPIHIHEGTCAKLIEKPKYPLTTVQDGKSMTTLKDMKLSALENGDFAINVHKSTTDIPTYVSCGDIPKMAMKGM